MADSSRLVIFAKAPVPGRVKTRMLPPLTPVRAAAIQDASLRDVVERARGVAADLRICCADGDGAAAWFGKTFADLEVLPQGPGGLGRRLSRVFDNGFDGGLSRLVVIGSDSPTLPTEELHAAFAALETVDVVVGPASDGGYYLVGLHARAWPRGRRLFRDIPWSTDAVFAVTARRAATAGLELHVLRTWYDIDRFSDLRLAREDAAAGSNLARELALLPDLELERPHA